MRKLWNRPYSAIWSLVTKSSDGIFNMNICSYVTPISMEPKVMMVAIYHNTKTRENITAGQTVRLQLLVEAQAPLVKLLGQQSGHKVNKISRLEKREAIIYQENVPLLKGCAGYLDMTITDIVTGNFDHDLVICSVTTHKNLVEDPILTTTYLKEHKFTR